MTVPLHNREQEFLRLRLRGPKEGEGTDKYQVTELPRGLLKVTRLPGTGLLSPSNYTTLPSKIHLTEVGSGGDGFR